MNEITSNVMMEKLISDIESIVSAAKEKIAGSVNSVMTETYWTIGKYIVEFEQDGQTKSAYGSGLLTALSNVCSTNR